MMRYEDCPHGVKREVLETNIFFWCGWCKMSSVGIEPLNALMSEYIAMNPYT